jgi:asparagine synthase (glutamine-hydrolysing)
VPDEILDRPKQGFSVPLSAWLRTDLRSWAHEVLLDRATLARGYFDRAEVRRLLDRHAGGADGDAKRIWSLLMLELWQREFIDARSAAPLAAVA